MSGSRESVTLAVDAMGGDHAPTVVLEGVAAALDQDPSLKILLCGPEEVVGPFASEHDRCEAVFAHEVIAMDEHPAHAVKTKKDSSIVIGCRLVKDGHADGFFSAGSTGACLAAATLVMGRIRGVKRPALGIIIPSYDKPTLLLDVGANADCKPEYLVQFATMGQVYSQQVMGVEHPRVGLLNIGEEDTKGSSFAIEVNQLLQKRNPDFGGNCEGGDLLQGRFDVVVTDGFTGNVCLKTIEGTAKLMFKLVKDALMSSLVSKMGALLVKGSLAGLKDKVSPDTYGGSPLLGVQGVCMIGHGSSSPRAIKNGILAGCREARSRVSDTIGIAIKEGVVR